MKRHLLLTLAFFLCLTSLSLAQHNIIDETTEIGNVDYGANERKFKNVNSGYTLTPKFVIGGELYPDLEQNFKPSTELRAVGDINKDGFQDFYYSVYAANAETEDLSDRVVKTKLFYGSSTGLSEANSAIFVDSSSLFKANMSLINDLTGDGIAEGYIFTDSKLTIYSAASEGSLSQVESFEILSDIGFSPKIKSFGDFNHDGFNDLLVYSSQTYNYPESVFYLIFGAQNISNVSVKKITNNNILDSNIRYLQLMYSDLDGDGTTEIIQVVGLQSQNIGNIMVYNLGVNDSLSTIATLDFPSGSYSPSNFSSNDFTTIDINNDGFKELVTFIHDRTYVFTNDITSAANIFDVINYHEFLGTGFQVIGDFNDDTFTDLLILGETNSVVAGSSDLKLNTFVPNLGEGSFSRITRYANNIGNNGDVNGDGIDDLVLEFSMEDAYGYRTFFGNSSFSFTNTSEIKYPLPYLSLQFPSYTLNAGDLNKDGIDDYGIVYEGSESIASELNRLEIFYGGDLSKTSPDIVISHPDKYKLSAPATGDFNGDGYPDIVVNYKDETSGIRIYLGGMVMDNQYDYELTFGEMFPEVLGQRWASAAFEAPQNAKDINNDGFEDIVFSAYGIPEKTYILYGGNSFSAAPDLEIDYFATNFVGLKDFNGDGINDLAISYFYDNTIKIYSGFDEGQGESFSQEPLVTIFEHDINEERTFTFFGLLMDGGDYNGDGFSDIVVAPYFHYSRADRTIGVESQYIYLGGTNPDNLFDHRFGLKTTLFMGVGNTQQSSVFLTSHLGELTTVPDQNGDGADEILVGTNPGYYGTDANTNAVIYYGATDVTQINEGGDIIFQAPNQSLGLGAFNNNILSQTAHTAIGDFDGDKKNDFLLNQRSDINFVKDPVYIYSSQKFSVNTEEEINGINEFSLNQNYPNPFNPTSVISFNLPKATTVSLKVYDVTGRLVSTLINNQKETAGAHNITVNAREWSSGVYFYRLEADGFVATKKLTLIK